MIWSVIVYVALLFMVVVVQASVLTKNAGAAYNLSNRTGQRADKTDFETRVDNALGNLKEGAVMFLPLMLLAILFEITNDWVYFAALLTIISRLLYVPVYFIGIEKIRTLIFLPSLLAIPLLLVGIVTGL